MNPISKQFSSIEQVTGQYLKHKNVTSPSTTSDVSFEDVLRQQQQLKFSKHASQRLESRNISLSEEQNARLEDKINNYYVSGDDPRLIARFLQEIVRCYHRDYTIRSVTLTRHAEVFRAEGFVPVREWKEYVAMEYGKNRRP